MPKRGMNVYLTFDVEVWCDGWEALDERFPAAFDRCILGRSDRGDWGLPQTLSILDQHGLKGIFFVDPMFSARFGSTHLQRIVDLIGASGHDVQLHLHPEWTDEIAEPPIADASRKRQHLVYYSLDEQSQLIAFGRGLLEACLGRKVTAFRAGSFAVNDDTYVALARNGLFVDTSFNEVFAHSSGAMRRVDRFQTACHVDRVTSYPVTVFRDGFGRMRPAQVTACSFAELRGALLSAHDSGCRHFVLVSHSFELLKPDRRVPDPIVVRRFQALCAFLARHPDRFQVGTMQALGPADSGSTEESRPHVGVAATAERHVEQLLRRLANLRPAR